MQMKKKSKMFNAIMLVSCFWLIFFGKLFLNVENSYAVDDTYVSSNNQKTAWGAFDAPSANDDAFWHESSSGYSLMPKSKAKNSLNSKNSLGPHKIDSPVETKKELTELVAKDVAISGETKTVGNKWDNASSDESKFDEDLKKQTHDVIGAYGKMVDDEDFKLKMGPELYVPLKGADTYQGSHNPSNSELGLGMKMEWGF